MYEFSTDYSKSLQYVITCLVLEEGAAVEKESEIC